MLRKFQTVPIFGILLVTLMVPGRASAFWGYGMYGGMGICPGGMFPGAGANSKDDYADFLRQEVGGLRADLRDVRRRARGLAERVNQYEEALGSIGALGDIAAQHMRTQRACIGGYVSVSQKSSPGNEGRQAVPDKSFSLWEKVCLSKGRVRPDICATSPHPLCGEAVAMYGAASHRLEGLAEEEQAIAATIRDRQSDLRQARKKALNDNDSGLEAFCLPCMLMGNPMASGFGGVGGPGILPQIGGMQSLLQQPAGINPRIAQLNQKLSWGTPQNFGYPFAMNRSYGSIPGAMGAGGFGCAPGMDGLNPLFGGLGPYGYPNASGPQPRYPFQGQSGGMYRPGFTPVGVPGPWGIGGQPPPPSQNPFPR